MSIKEAIERDGYAVVRSLLTPSEIDRLRDALIAHFAGEWRWEGLGKHQPNAALEIPAISWLFTHPPIVAAFRTLFGREDLVFTTNCDAHMNMLSWWHKDTSEGAGGCFSGNYFAREKCGVYRAGVYLQDHLSNPHGLKVRRGSHHARWLDSGEAVILRTRAGDVVFFDIRTTHAGQFADPVETVLLRAGRWLRREAEAAAIKDRYQRFLGKRQKLSIFFTYGMPGRDTDEFCAFELGAKRARSKKGALSLPPDLAAGLKLADIASPL